MAQTYPFGYSAPGGGGQMLTIPQLMTRKTVYNVHPEMRRRVFAMMEAAAAEGVALGIGTGWRKQPTNPDGSQKDGFAKPGNSYHEGFMPGGKTRPDGTHDTDAMAFDMVPSSSWPWMDRNITRFGLLDFKHVNNEIWHIQPVEIPHSRDFATKPPPIGVFVLPGDTPPPVPLIEEDVMQFLTTHSTGGVAHYIGTGAGWVKVQVYTSADQAALQAAGVPLVKLTDAQIVAYDVAASTSKNRLVAPLVDPFDVKLV